MPAVDHLVTVVDLDEADGRTAPGPPDPRTMSLRALHLAVLADGGRLTLLDDRGWSVSGPPDIWRRTSLEGIEADARMVVGPDEPFGERSQADMATTHWDYLAGILARRGVRIAANQLRELAHAVELTYRLRTRLLQG